MYKLTAAANIFNASTGSNLIPMFCSCIHTQFGPEPVVLLLMFLEHKRKECKLSTYHIVKRFDVFTPGFIHNKAQLNHHCDDEHLTIFVATIKIASVNLRT
jgi:hypothetical protein